MAIADRSLPGPLSATAAIAAGALVGAVASTAAGIWYQLLRRPLPRTAGSMTIDGLDDDVEIRRDRWGVPLVNARTRHDLWFGQGFCHGQDRLWQLELYRRTAAGRISEIAGAETLPTDRLMRTLGFRRVAEREEAELAPELRGELEALCAGVNAAAEARPLPFEFQVLRLGFDPWTPADILAATKLLAFGLSTNWERELLRAEMARELGPDRAALLDPTYPLGHPLATRPGDGFKGPGLEIAEQIDRVRETLGLAVEASGSNNWAVSGARSASGSPMLAGDPHLPPSMPGIWYQAGLKLGEREARGATIPGIPGIYMGHNNDVAWSFTNVMADVQDLYIERIDGERYEHAGAWRPLEEVAEDIVVKGRSAARAGRRALHPPRAPGHRCPRDRRDRAARASLRRARDALRHPGADLHPRPAQRPGAAGGAGAAHPAGVEPALGRPRRRHRLQADRPDPDPPRRLPRPAEAGLDRRVRVGRLRPPTRSCPRRAIPTAASSSPPTTGSSRRTTRTTSPASTSTATAPAGSNG